MGIALVIGLFFFAGMLSGIFLSGLGTASKRELKNKLNQAQDVIFQIDGVLFDFIGQLDIVGNAMVDKIREPIGKFRRGMIK